jgi:hypothetical protein
VAGLPFSGKRERNYCIGMATVTGTILLGSQEKGQETTEALHGPKSKADVAVEKGRHGMGFAVTVRNTGGPATFPSQQHGQDACSVPEKSCERGCTFSDSVTSMIYSLMASHSSNRQIVANFNYTS